MNTDRMEIIKRDDSDFEFTFKDINGVVINLTNCEVFFTVKRKQTDSDANAVISKNITSFDHPETGVAKLSLTSTDTNINTGAYFFDIQLKTSDNKITSSGAGRFIVSQDITVRTS